MDIKTLVLGMPLGFAMRYLANQALAIIVARWPGVQGILLGTRPKENIMLKITFSETPAEERWILHGRLADPWVHELRKC
jgi:hypothetical protein